MINWKASDADPALIMKIGMRALKIYKAYGIETDLIEILMDVAACHLNGNPLLLRDMLEADEFNFMHDILGIARHINRKNGHLENCFSPRFSV